MQGVAYQYKRGECPHPGYSKEVILGQKTGDIICSGCGEDFMPGEPEFEKMVAERAQRMRERGTKAKE